VFGYQKVNLNKSYNNIFLFAAISDVPKIEISIGVVRVAPAVDELG
jgi:hypothetical protein